MEFYSILGDIHCEQVDDRRPTVIVERWGGCGVDHPESEVRECVEKGLGSLRCWFVQPCIEVPANRTGISMFIIASPLASFSISAVVGSLSFGLTYAAMIFNRSPFRTMTLSSTRTGARLPKRGL